MWESGRVILLWDAVLPIVLSSFVQECHIRLYGKTHVYVIIISTIRQQQCMSEAGCVSIHV